MSKQNRQKKKEAKIQRRKQRQKGAQKPAPQATERDRMDEFLAVLESDQSLTNQMLVMNPSGQEKMSEVLEQFIDPYLDEVDDVASLQRLATVAAVAWNAAIFGDDRRESFLALVLDTFPEEVRPEAAEIIEEMIRRKQRYFAKNQRRITRVRVTEVGDGFHLAVASSIPSEEQ